MDLRHLRYFVAVAEELSFTKAAERLHKAQPPVSQQIRQLEEEIGVTLLLRTRRHVELTEAGRVFLDQARQILRSTESAVVQAQRAQRGEIGRITVGFFEHMSYTLLPPILLAYRERVGARPAVQAALERIGPGQTGVLVTHGVTARALTADLIGLDQSLAWRSYSGLVNCHWARRGERADGWRIDAWNVGGCVGAADLGSA